MARPAWTLTEAVARTGVSRSTLRRQLDAGKFPGAYKDSSNAWRFPLEDLLAAGLSVSAPASEQAQSVVTEQANTATDEQVNALERALAVERARADSAERLAASYQENVQDLRRALLMLDAGPSRPERASEQAQSVVTEQATQTPAPLTEQPMSAPEQVEAIHQFSSLTPKDGSKPVPLFRRLFGRKL